MRRGRAPPVGVSLALPADGSLARRLLPVLALGLVGCASGVTLRSRYALPAAVPARTFPVAYVAADAGPLSAALAESIARYLRDAGTRVVEAPPNDVFALASQSTSAALVLYVSTQVDSQVSTETHSTPSVDCSSYAVCVRTHDERTESREETLRATAVIRVMTPTGGELDLRMVQADEDRIDEASLVVLGQRLVAQVLALFDGGPADVPVVLEQPTDPAGARGLDLVRSGDLDAARRAFSAAVDASTDAAPAERARLLHDLAQLLRLSPTESPQEEDERFARAEDALVTALALADDDLHARTLAAVRQERTARRDVHAQEDARARNFASLVAPE